MLEIFVKGVCTNPSCVRMKRMTPMTAKNRFNTLEAFNAFHFHFILCLKICKNAKSKAVEI